MAWIAEQLLGMILYQVNREVGFGGNERRV